MVKQILFGPTFLFGFKPSKREKLQINPAEIQDVRCLIARHMTAFSVEGTRNHCRTSWVLLNLNEFLHNRLHKALAQIVLSNRTWTRTKPAQECVSNDIWN